MSVPSQGVASESGLVLDLQVDEGEYLQDQRVEVAVCLRNQSQYPFRDLAPLHPLGGYLALSLVNQTTGKPIPEERIAPLGVLDHEGVTLSGGQIQCEAFNLLAWFGREGGDGSGPARCIGSRSLEPGKYRLSATFYARSGFVPELPAAVVRSGTVEFSVVPISMNPTEAALVGRFIESCPKVEGFDRGPIGRHCAAWLPSFKNSPYFMLIYYFTGRLMTSISADSLLATLDRRAGNGVRQASFIALRCNIEQLSDEDRRKWMQALRARRGDALSQSVIDAWLSRTPTPKAPR